MTLLLDTHAFLWFCQDDPALSATAKAMIEDPANRKLVSRASCWEIAIKAGLGRLALGEPSATYIPNALARIGFHLLIAQARLEAVRIVSVDAAFDAYGVSRIW